MSDCNAALKTEILAQLEKYICSVDSEKLSEFAAFSEEELALCHFGLGLYIRNNLLRPQDTLYQLFVSQGVTKKDDMSSAVLREWQTELRARGI